MAESIKKDLVIIGGGPAGLSAAIYAQRALLDNVVLEQEAVGGQIILTSEVDNSRRASHGWLLACRRDAKPGKGPWW